MNHATDQDLLMLSHRSLGFFQSISLSLHLRGCQKCRKRYAEFALVSVAVATTVRIGLPAWKPLGLAIRTKLLLGVLLVSGGVWGVKTVIPPAVEPMPPLPAGVVATEPIKCDPVTGKETNAGVVARPIDGLKKGPNKVAVPRGMKPKIQ